MKKLLGLLLLFLTSAALAGEGGFLFVTTRGQDSAMAEQVYFGLSKDGMQWEILNGGAPVLVNTLGEKGARDPYLLRAEDGKFYVLATNLSIFASNRNWKRALEAGGRSIVLWDSSDLVHWSEPRLVEVAPPDAGCAWAPEAIYDPSQRKYLVYWASTTKADSFRKQRVWGAWTTDFQTFSEPFIYWERAGHVGDPDIVLGDDGKYYRFFRDGAANAIAMEVSDSLTGQWQAVLGFHWQTRRPQGALCAFCLRRRKTGNLQRGACL